jgi:uncharacterized repeat protein (TIGR01451 family)
MNLRIALFALAAVVVAAPAAAQVSLENKVLKETTVRAADGTVTTKVAPMKSLAPGETAVYVMTYRNGGRTPASNLVINNPVSKDVRYAGPAANSATPVVSVDGGRTFGQLQTLTVAGPNGRRAAQFADVTHVRWTVAGPVAPGSSGSVSYKGVVR